MDKTAIAASRLLKVLAGTGGAAVALGGAGAAGHYVGMRSGARKTADAMTNAFMDANTRENQAITNAFGVANAKENRMLAQAYLKKGYELGMQHRTRNIGIKAAEDVGAEAFAEELEKLGFSVKGMKIDASTLKRLAGGLGASYKALGKGVSEAASLGAAKVTRRVPAGMKHLRVKGMKEALKAAIPAAAVTGAAGGAVVGARKALKKNASEVDIAQFLLEEMEKDAALPAALMALLTKAAPAAKALGKSFGILGRKAALATPYLRGAAGKGIPMGMRGQFLGGAARQAGRALATPAARPAALALGGAGLFGAGRMSKRRGPRFVAY